MAKKAAFNDDENKKILSIAPQKGYGLFFLLFMRPNSGKPRVVIEKLYTFDKYSRTSSSSSYF